MEGWKYSFIPRPRWRFNYDLIELRPWMSSHMMMAIIVIIVSMVADFTADHVHTFLIIFILMYFFGKMQRNSEAKSHFYFVMQINE